MENGTTINRVELETLETHEVSKDQIRVEVTLALNNRTQMVERISQNNSEAILNEIGLATLDAIRALIPRPLECQIDYIKEVEIKPALAVQCLLRLRESGKETFLSGSATVSNSSYEAAAQSMLDALGRTLERMIELQQKRERLRSGAFTVKDGTLAIASDISEKQQEKLLEAKTQPLDVNIVSSTGLDIDKDILFSPEPITQENAFNQIINTTRAKELYDQGEALVRKGNYVQAVNLLKEATSLDTTNADYYCQLGIALSNSLNTMSNKEAEVAFLKAVELQPKVAAYYTELGIFYKDIGRIDKSQRALEQAVELDVADARAKRTLTTVRELMCTFEPAAKEGLSTSQSVELNRLSELKTSLQNKPPEKTIRDRISERLTPRLVLVGVGLVLAVLTSFAGGTYFYNYFRITATTKLSDAERAQPNYVALKIVQNFPSPTNGLSIKESVDKYLNEQKIPVHSWFTVRESKSSRYMVILTLTKDNKDQTAIWGVELGKKVCTPENDLAKQFTQK